MRCHCNVMTLDVIFWHLFWSRKTSKFYGNVMTFWWDSTGFLWEKGILVKCHENVKKFQWHSMGLKILVHFDGILMEKVHGIVMEFDVIFDQNSDWNQWWHFIMRAKTSPAIFSNRQKSRMTTTSIYSIPDWESPHDQVHAVLECDDEGHESKDEINEPGKTHGHDEKFAAETETNAEENSGLPGDHRDEEDGHVQT